MVPVVAVVVEGPPDPLPPTVVSPVVGEVVFPPAEVVPPPLVVFPTLVWPVEPPAAPWAPAPLGPPVVGPFVLPAVPVVRNETEVLPDEEALARPPLPPAVMVLVGAVSGPHAETSTKNENAMSGVLTEVIPGSGRSSPFGVGPKANDGPAQLSRNHREILLCPDLHQDRRK